ncbi:MAG: PilZ domain-containing protein [Sphingomonas sp.]
MLDSFQDNELTTEPLFGTPLAKGDRRNQQRHVTVLRVAKLSTPRSEEFCLVRNISAGGMMAHIYSELEVGDPVHAEISSGHRISGKILWRREGVAGIGFDEHVDPVSILSGEVHAPVPQRAPRVGIDVRARIRVGTQYRFVTLCNISQGGASISPPEPGELGQKIILMANGLPPIAGVVRWQDQHHAGIKFDVPLSFDLLAKWVPTLRR